MNEEDTGDPGKIVSGSSLTSSEHARAYNTTTVTGAYSSVPAGLQARSFNGTSSYVEYAPTTVLHDNFQPGTSSYTFEAMVKFTGTGGAILSKLNSTGTSGYYIGTNGSQVEVLMNGTSMLYDPATATLLGCGAPVVNDGNWHYISLVRNATLGKLRLYIDGYRAKEMSYSTTANIANSDPLYAGVKRQGVSYTNWFNGTIDDVRLTPVARNAAQVEATWQFLALSQSRLICPALGF